MAVVDRARGVVRDDVGAREGARSISVAWVEVAVALAIFLPIFGVYLLTLSPGLTYNSIDANELTTVPYILGLAHSTGYPLFTWLGHAFDYVPIRDIAYRMNLLSAVSAGVACICLYGVMRLTISSSEQGAAVGPGRGRKVLAMAAAAFGAVLFGLSTTMWSQAVITEVYAANTMMLALTILLLLVWSRYEAAGPNLEKADAGSLARFGMFALAFGFSLGTHMSNLGLAPGFIVYIVLVNPRVLRQPQFIGMGLLAFGLGVLQFVWLPLKAHDLNDPTVRNAPSSLHGVYEYTLGAFPQFKFAFPLSDLPNRMVLYLHYMRANFHIGGIFLGLVGAAAMSVRAPKLFFLFMTGYVVQVGFFIDYGVADLDVFFIIAHLIFAVFAAYGAWWLMSLVVEFAMRPRGADDAGSIVWRPQMGLAVVVAGLIALQPGLSLAGNWGVNDQSANTGIEDFYKLAWAQLPANASLNGSRGVFGYDAFYYRLVYGLRPDVSLPGSTPATSRQQTRTSAQPAQNLFTLGGVGGIGGFGGFGRGFGGFGGGGGFGPNATWSVPVLASPTVRDDSVDNASRQLTLYESSSTMPQLFVSNVTPTHETNASFGNLTLVGYDTGGDSVKAGDAIDLKLYWRVQGNGAPVVATKIGDTPYFETHPLGFGNLQRYLQSQGQPAAGSLMVEDYKLVVLSSTEAGEQPIRVRAGNGAWVQVGSIEVTK